MQFYRGLIVPQDGGSYGVVFPDLPGCVSAGMTLQEAANNAAEALALHIESMIEDGETLPAPSALDAPLPDWLREDLGDVVTSALIPVELPGKTVRANITVDEALLRRIDAAASAEGFTRSGFLAQAARDRLHRIETTR